MSDNNEHSSVMTSGDEDRKLEVLDTDQDTGEDSEDELLMVRQRVNRVMTTTRMYWCRELVLKSEFCGPVFTLFSVIGMVCARTIGDAVLRKNEVLGLLITLALLLNVANLIMCILLVIRTVENATLTELWLQVIWQSVFLGLLTLYVLGAIKHDASWCDGNIGCKMILIVQIIITATEIAIMWIVTVHVIRIRSRDGANGHNFGNRLGRREGGTPTSSA